MDRLIALNPCWQLLFLVAAGAFGGAAFAAIDCLIEHARGRRT